MKLIVQKWKLPKEAAEFMFSVLGQQIKKHKSVCVNCIKFKSL